MFHIICILLWLIMVLTILSVIIISNRPDDLAVDNTAVHSFEYYPAKWDKV